MNLNRLIPIAILALACSASTTWAQCLDNGTVSGTGNVTLARKPEVMRLQIIVQGRGKIIKEALLRLKSRVESAREEVERLGADKDSIKVAETRIMPPEDNSQQQQMQMQIQMIKAQRADAKAHAAKDKAPAPILVSTELSAEWPLKGKDGDDLLIAVHSIQEKIKEADLAAAKKDVEDARAESGLSEEEFRNMLERIGDSGEPKPGEPLFLFVCSIAEDEIDKGTAEAFRKAAKDATRLAKAAGARLGKLNSLNGSSMSEIEMGNLIYGGNNMHIYRTRQAAQRIHNEAQENDPAKFEAIGVEPTLIRHTITVIASFDLAAQK